MKKFIIILSVFLVLLLSILTILDYTISRGLQLTDSRKFQIWNDIFASKIHSDIVILGSSRADRMFSTIILDSIVGLDFYNLGIEGHTFDFQLIRYNTYRRFNIKPKYVIMNIDFHSTFGFSNGYEKEQFFPYIYDDSLISEVKKASEITYWDRKIPFYRYIGYPEVIKLGFETFRGKLKSTDGGVIKGFKNYNDKWDGTRTQEIKMIFYKKNPAVIKMFNDYLTKCEKEGIIVILVSAPVYISATKKIVDLKSMNILFENIAKQHNLQILDYTNDSICGDTLNFGNSTHLNKKGTELFSIKLANDLKKLIKTTNKNNK